MGAGKKVRKVLLSYGPEGPFSADVGLVCFKNAIDGDSTNYLNDCSLPMLGNF